MKETIEHFLAGKSDLFVGAGIGLWVAAIITFAFAARSKARQPK